MTAQYVLIPKARRDDRLRRERNPRQDRSRRAGRESRVTQGGPPDGRRLIETRGGPSPRLKTGSPPVLGREKEREQQMGFLDDEPDLSETTFTPEDHRNAKTYFRSFLETHDPEWLLRPSGPIAIYWRAAGPAPGAYMVELFRLAATLRNQGVPPARMHELS